MKFGRLSLQQKSGFLRIFYNAINSLHEIFEALNLLEYALQNANKINDLEISNNFKYSKSRVSS